MKILVTGGCGFIGSAVIRYLINNTNHQIVNVDRMTYAASRDALEEAEQSSRYQLVQADISNASLVEWIFVTHQPDAVMHLAAETHVDRSIDGPAAFMQTNIMGPYTLLEASRRYYNNLPPHRQSQFRFHHISTDEVWGSLGPRDQPFNESTAYDPRSPYSASKASSDHLVRAWYHTYGLPVVVSNTTNNYGPWQFPDKLIPLTIINAIEGRTIRVYGNGGNIRDWLYVNDHAQALVEVLQSGVTGVTYPIGAQEPRTNLQVVHSITQILDQLVPDPKGPRDRLIEFATDRPGHDWRYEIDPSYTHTNLGWKASTSFEPGVEQTVRWYLDHQDWWRNIRAQGYAGQRLGTL